ncbi:hypothetical protein A2774_05935 [Candidatus Roizmanbacteria bacterium RIFCSPHIGHO2_01_FULL_39_12c]|uniref:Uncharacterized protein n=1 Tax=Candidatus Roizmanbacteria bacterium RIFCSPHIGHO2_01_FULL_39_12c TaxID=1802031 RepID=A0A1F7GAD3_9BACT|nr:MAG: hypothetical protein A2774_05935 [Candidatus Roizmanbacteria bacterium RIFCSPHIGHO2_01_FULL_39_12c]OGK46472.1 MAG: hypothetical protein A2963_01750 [Candidatus Roizmanbacteria bacterium RIFCSPLOWO2_01_FULL_40_13]
MTEDYKSIIGSASCNEIKDVLHAFLLAPGSPKCNEARKVAGLQELTLEEAGVPMSEENKLRVICLICPVLARTLAYFRGVSIYEIPPDLKAGI